MKVQNSTSEIKTWNEAVNEFEKAAASLILSGVKHYGTQLAQTYLSRWTGGNAEKVVEQTIENFSGEQQNTTTNDQAPPLNVPH